VPAGHGLHDAEPGSVLYVPVEHKTQFWPSGPVDPGLHLQSTKASLAGAEFEFGGQLEQSEDQT